MIDRAGRTGTTVRPLSAKDCAAAAKFCERTIRWASGKYLKGIYPKEGVEFDVHHYSEDKIRERLKQPDRFAFVAMNGTKMVGILTGRVYGKSGVAMFTWIAVDPDHQHEGVGLKLLVRAEEHLRGCGCHKMSLHTLPALVPAIKLYMKFGLLPEAYLRQAWWGADFLLMSKWIGSYTKTR